MEMRPGAVLDTRSIRAVFHVPKGETGIKSVDFKAPKGEVFSFIFLGAQPADGSKPLDPVEALKRLGWTPPPGLEKES